MCRFDLADALLDLCQLLLCDLVFQFYPFGLRIQQFVVRLNGQLVVLTKFFFQYVILLLRIGFLLLPYSKFLGHVLGLTPDLVHLGRAVFIFCAPQVVLLLQRVEVRVIPLRHFLKQVSVLLGLQFRKAGLFLQQLVIGALCLRLLCTPF